MIRMLLFSSAGTVRGAHRFLLNLLGRLGKRIPEMEADINNRKRFAEAATNGRKNISGEGSVEAMAAEEAKAELEKTAVTEKEKK